MQAFVHDAAHDMQMARDQLLATITSLTDADLGRYVPYGDRTVHDVLAHLAGADHVWALAAQGLLRGEADQRPPLTPEQAADARARAIDRGRGQRASALIEEMERRRKLLLGLYELLEKRHLAMRLPTFGDAHNGVRERIWLGYHDRLHRADIDRAMRMTWHPQRLAFLPELQPAVDALSPDETLYVIFSVDPSHWERPVRGLEWTHRELLAHIAVGDWVLQGHLRHIIERGEVDAWPDVDAGNAARQEERRLSNEHALVEEYLSMRHETLRLIAQLQPKHLQLAINLRWLPAEQRESTVFGYLLAFPQHDANHRDQLRPAMKHMTSTR